LQNAGYIPQNASILQWRLKKEWCHVASFNVQCTTHRANQKLLRHKRHLVINDEKNFFCNACVHMFSCSRNELLFCTCTCM
jgi:hypothetical protein